MRIVLTGSKGMIGSRLAKALRARGYDILCTWFDLADPVYPEMDLEGGFVVVHAAGRKTGEAAILSRDNVLATQRLLESLCLRDECRGLVYFSSIAAFGIQEETITEQSPRRPDTFYGFSKMVCEDLIRSALHERPCAIIRPTNTIASSTENIVGMMVSLALRGESFEAWESSLRTKRDYILVDDVVDAAVELARRFASGESGGRMEMNLCMSSSHSLAEVLTEVEAATGKQLSLNVTDSRAFRGRDLYVSSDAFCRLLGREPAGLGAAVRRVVAEMTGELEITER